MPLTFQSIKITFLTCSILIIINCTTFAQKKLTLRQAIEISLQNNLQIRAAKVSESQSYLDVSKAKKNVLPSINLSAVDNLNFGRTLDPVSNTYITQNATSSTGNITTTLTLFQGRQKTHQIQQNKYQLEANKSNTNKVANDIIIQVVASFLAVLNYNDQLIAAHTQYDLAKTQLEFELKRFQVGKKTLADLSRSKFELSKTEVNVTTLENNLNQSAVELKLLMNISPNTAVELVQPTDTEFKAKKSDSIASLFSMAVNRFPEIQRAEFDRLSALQSVKIAKSLYYPALSLSGAVASSYLHEFHYTPSIFSFNTKQTPFFNQVRNNSYEYIGLNLSIPILNGFNAKIAVGKARLDVERAVINKETAINDLYKIINQAVSDYNAAEKNFLSSKQSLEFAKETFEVIKKRYINGSSNSLDFSQAQNDMNQAQLMLIDSKYTLIFKAKVLDFYSGKPISY